MTCANELGAFTYIDSRANLLRIGRGASSSLGKFDFIARQSFVIFRPEN